MGSSTAAIRSGFDYQDLYCGSRLLQLIEEGSLDYAFIIESDEVQFVDDLQIFPPGSGMPIGCQVKYHVTKDHVATFDSLVEHVRSTAKSQLQKLYAGWQTLSNDGEHACQLRFFTASAVDGSAKELGSCIESYDNRIGDRFYSKGTYDLFRQKWVDDLGIPAERLRQFLDAVYWEFSGPALIALKQRIVDSLRRIGLPNNSAAVLAFQDLIRGYALHIKERTSIAAFIQALAEIPQFREACEQKFSQLLLGNRVRTRAHTVRVACIDFRTLHSLRCHEFACDEEPAPLLAYTHGLSVPSLSGVFDDYRGKWNVEHRRWVHRRLKKILEWLSSKEIDVVVFPRYTIDSDAALDVIAWCNASNCNAVFGGDYAQHLENVVADLEALMNVRVTEPMQLNADGETLVVDAFIRPARAGRASLSRVISPYNSRREVACSKVVPCDIMTASGVITAVSLPSVVAVDAYSSGGAHAPELAISSCGPLADALRSRLNENSILQGVPSVLCTPTTSESASAIVLNSSNPDATSSAAWEGITAFEARYERPGQQGWVATISEIWRAPICYHANAEPETILANGEWLDELRGVRASIGYIRYQATLAQNGMSPKDVVIIDDEDPDNFFLRRLGEAEDALRDVVSSLESDQMIAAGKAKGEIVDRIRQLEVDRVIAYSGRIPSVQQHEVIRPPLVDRTAETQALSHFVDGGAGFHAMLMHGPNGIGKGAILDQVARVTTGSNGWVVLNALPNSTFAEFIGLLFLEMGESLDAPPTLDSGTYDSLFSLFVEHECDVIVIGNAEHLPLGAGENAHSDFTEFLSRFVLSTAAQRMRLLLISARQGSIQAFPGRHLFDLLKVKGLEHPDMLRLMQDLAAAIGVSATTQELEQLATLVHGHPGLAEIAIGLLAEVSASELIDSLHRRTEVQHYIVNQVLGRDLLTTNELMFLKYASLFRISIEKTAFATLSGAHARAIISNLKERLLLVEEGMRIRVHPLIADHFRARIAASESRSLHRMAFAHLETVLKKRMLTIDESAERIYHALRAGETIDLRDYQMFLGPARGAMIRALREREWKELLHISKMVLEALPSDPVAIVIQSLATEGNGQPVDPGNWTEAALRLDSKDVWIAVEYVRFKIRTHDYKMAAEMLDALERRYGLTNRIRVVQAQLAERRGNPEEAVDACLTVLLDKRAHIADVRSAISVLRRADRLEEVVQNLDMSQFGNKDDIQRAYAYACVVSNHAPAAGLEALERFAAESPNDGHALADFAGALAAIGQDAAAESLFEKGIKTVTKESGYWTVVEEYALFSQHREKYGKAIDLLRRLHEAKPFLYHITRRFAKCLFEYAKEAKENGDYLAEGASIQEAELVLKELQERAPADKWAQYALDKVRRHDYGSKLVLDNDKGLA